MDTGKLNNTVFYDGFEGEGELILSIPNATDMAMIHIWDGYFEDIFGNPLSTNAGWSGFTKDYQESIRTFDGEDCISSSAVSEYLFDLKKYENHTFTYPETRDCLKLLIHFFEQAVNLSESITVTFQ